MPSTDTTPAMPAVTDTVDPQRFGAELKALEDLRLGVSMDQAHLDDASVKLRALDLAINAFNPATGIAGDVLTVIDIEAICAAFHRRTGRSLDRAEIAGAILDASFSFPAPVAIHPAEVLVALERIEEYEDVHPELLADDAIKGGWPRYRTIVPQEKG